MQWGKELVPPQERNKAVVRTLGTCNRAWRDMNTNKFRIKLLNILKQSITVKDSSASPHVKTIFLACQWNPNKSSIYLHMLCFSCYITVFVCVSLWPSLIRVIWEEVPFLQCGAGLSYADYFTLILILVSFWDNLSRLLGYTQSALVSDKKNSTALWAKLSISDAETRELHIPEGKWGGKVNKDEHHRTPQHNAEEKGRRWRQTPQLPEAIWQPICSG